MKFYSATDPEKGAAVRGRLFRLLLVVLSIYFMLLFFLRYALEIYEPTLDGRVFLAAVRLLVHMGLAAVIIYYGSKLARLKDISLSDRACIFIISCVVIITRSLLITFIKVDMSSDFSMYYDMAKLYAETGMYNNTDYIMVVAPNIVMYVVILGEIFHVFGSSLFTAQIVNMVLLTGSCIFTYLTAREFLNKRQSLLCALAFAVSPSNLMFSLVPSTESLALLPYMAGLWLMIRAVKNAGTSGLWRAAVGGFLLGFSNTTRTNAVTCMAAIAFWALFHIRTKKGRQRLYLISLVAVMGIMSMLTQRLYGVIRSEMFQGQETGMTLGWTLYEGLDNETAGGWRQENLDVLNETIENEPLTEVQDIMMEKMLERVSEYSAETWALLILRKGVNIWIYNDYGYNVLTGITEDSPLQLSDAAFSAVQFITNEAYLIALMTFCAAMLYAAFVSVRKKQPLPSVIPLLVIPIMLLVLWHSLGSSIPRYHYMLLPFLPMLIMCAAHEPAEILPSEEAFENIAPGRIKENVIRAAAALKERLRAGNVLAALMFVICSLTVIFIFIQGLRHEYTVQGRIYPVWGYIALFARLFCLLAVIIAAFALLKIPARRLPSSKAVYAAVLSAVIAAAAAIRIWGFLETGTEWASEQLETGVAQSIIELEGKAAGEGTLLESYMTYAARNASGMYYPVFILPLLIRITGDGGTAVMTGNIIFGTLSVLLAAKAGRTLTGKRSVGILCAAAAALWPPAVASCTKSVTVPFVMCLLLLTIILISRITQGARGEAVHAAASLYPALLGIICGILQFCFPGALVLTIACALYLAFRKNEDMIPGGPLSHLILRSRKFCAVSMLLFAAASAAVTGALMHNATGQDIPGPLERTAYSAMTGMNAEALGQWNEEDAALYENAETLDEAYSTALETASERFMSEGLPGLAVLAAEKLSYIWRVHLSTSHMPFETSSGIMDPVREHLGLLSLAYIVLSFTGLVIWYKRSGGRQPALMPAFISSYISLLFLMAAGVPEWIFWMPVFLLPFLVLTAVPERIKAAAVQNESALFPDAVYVMEQGVVVQMSDETFRKGGEETEKDSWYNRVKDEDNLKLINGGNREENE